MFFHQRRIQMQAASNSNINSFLDNALLCGLCFPVGYMLRNHSHTDWAYSTHILSIDVTTTSFLVLWLTWLVACTVTNSPCCNLSIRNLPWLLLIYYMDNIKFMRNVFVLRCWDSLNIVTFGSLCIPGLGTNWQNSFILNVLESSWMTGISE